MNDGLQQGIAALKKGDPAGARQLFIRATQVDPEDEQAWLWLSGVVEDDRERLACISAVLAINPNNQAARRGLAFLKQKGIILPTPPHVVASLSPPKPQTPGATPAAAGWSPPKSAGRIIRRLAQEADRQEARKARNRMVRGLVLAIIGISTTCISYGLAHQEGLFTVYHGTIVFGLLDFAIGLAEGARAFLE